MAFVDDLPPWLERIVLTGVQPGDDEDQRLAKTVLTGSAVTLATVSPVWWISLLIQNRTSSAVIPLSYQIATYLGIRIVAMTGRYAPFRVFQLTTMLVLPAVLMWTLGGFASSGAMILWSFGAVLATQIFSIRRRPWTLSFVALVVISAAIDPWLVANVTPLGADASRIYFLINLVGSSVTSAMVIRLFIGQRDRARAELDTERLRSERLLRNVLPEPIAARLKAGESPIADAAPSVMVLFADIVGFTPIAASMMPDDVVAMLNHAFTRLDQLAAHHGLEKIKTIGDEYMVVAGLPEPRRDHVEAIAGFALEAVGALDGGLQLRIGVQTGPVMAGVIGETRFAYDLWGDTVNIASRMESQGLPGMIQVTARVRDALGDSFRCEARGTIEVKGKGAMETFFLVLASRKARR